MRASKRMPRKFLRLAHRLRGAMASAQARGYRCGQRAPGAVELPGQARPAVFAHEATAVMERIHHFLAGSRMRTRHEHVASPEVEQPLRATEPSRFQGVRRCDRRPGDNQLEQRLRRVVARERITSSGGKHRIKHHGYIGVIAKDPADDLHIVA